MNLKKDLVSIISPCYNGEKYLPLFLESVLSQTYPYIELIVVNDASRDCTQEILEGYRNKFKKKGYSLIIINQQQNRGQAAAINVGLKLISGKYMTWMDSDDILYHDAIEKKVKYLEENQDIDFVMNFGEIVNEKDLNKRVGVLKRVRPSKNDFLFKDLIDTKNVTFGPGTILVKTDSLISVLPNLEIYESREGQNWQLMLPLSYSCKYGYLNEILFKYVIHDDSHSHLKRTYEEQIERRNNFYILHKNTIEKIIGMSENEKEYWYNYSYEKQLKEKYKISLQYRRFNEALVYNKELKKHKIELKFSEKLFVYGLYCILIAIMKKIKGDQNG